MNRIERCADLAESYDLVVVGAGPAGMSAASAAARGGLSVLLVDEAERVGGQIYRSVTASPVRDRKVLGDDYWKGAEIAARFEASDCTYAPAAVLWYLDRDLLIGLTLGEEARIIRAQHVVIATGAVERPFPVEGWTLPGVMTVGAAQILLKTAAVVPQGRVVLAGTGPLLWLFAWQCLKAGSPPSVILDTTPRGNWMKALPHLPGFLTSPYFRKGVALLRDVRAEVRVVSGLSTLNIRQAGGHLAVDAQRGATETFEADHVLLHQGLVPNINLASAAGCEIVWNEAQAAWQPRTDENGLTSVPGISIAGDGAMIGGAEVAVQRGELLGRHLAATFGGEASTNSENRVIRLSAYKRGRPFLDALYRPSDAFRRGTPATIACRCEEITCGEVTETARALNVAGPNQIKAFLRTGMGPCQGRYCGTTVSELIAEARGVPIAEVAHYRLRPPVKPITLGQLALVSHTDEEAKAVYRI